ncbi:cytochrome b [Blastochloris sulfoviridis]|uniref:Cytochrome b n=1 Tax=Blastochloris sulfoviridis TaxID=50712 RepID=A0A5M6I2U0_9HYPH|nr:cytochrome b [Blastochloris sulfoviridis]KAA5602105.1 cytochrome b [Blastochloris sulfoviridis]
MTTTNSAGTSAPGYDGVAVVLHWLIFFMVVGLFTSAQIAEGIGDQIKQLQSLGTDPEGVKALMGQRMQLMGMHKAGGVIVFALVAARLFWRATRGVPAPVETSPMIDLAAKAAHVALYALLIVMPVSGFLMSMYAGRGVDLLGIPPLLTPVPELAKQFSAVHGFTMNLILLVVFLHAAAALWHHYVRRDATLGRMVPWLRGQA